MKIQEWFKDPFATKRSQREREGRKRMEEVININIRSFLEDVINLNLRLKLLPPKISFTHLSPDFASPDQYRSIEYREGEIFINWTDLQTRSPEAIKRDYLIFAAITAGHELGHYLQDKLNLAHYKEKGRGLMESDFGKTTQGTLRAVGEDLSDYLAGLFLRYLVDNKTLNVSEQQRDVLIDGYGSVGNMFFERDSAGHGSRVHRSTLFGQGLRAKNPAEEVKLVFNDI